jgi:nucleoside-diphosphate-sugar epimerase
MRRGCGLPVVPEMAYFGFTYVDDIVEGIVRVMQKAPVRMVQRILMVSERTRA